VGRAARRVAAEEEKKKKDAEKARARRRRRARCNAPNFAVEFFFLFFTRQNSGVTFPFSFSPR
jgi:hypothetical protein